MVGPKKQKFWPEINVLKGNREAPVRQKLGMILENRLVQKLKLDFFFYKKWSPRLIFLNEILIFDIEN